MGRTTCTEPQCLFKGALYLTFLAQFHAGKKVPTEILIVCIIRVLCQYYYNPTK